MPMHRSGEGSGPCVPLASRRQPGPRFPVPGGACGGYDLSVRGFPGRTQILEAIGE